MRHGIVTTMLTAALLLLALADAAHAQSAPIAPTQAGSQPSAQTIARAKAAGLPAVDKGAQIAGPFEGPQGTLYYIKRDGRITYFHPEAATGYFGTLNPDGSMSFKYGLNIGGQYIFGLQGQARQVPVLPDDVYQWPHASAVAQVLIRRILQIQQGRAAAPAVDWAAASAASRALHETNRSILNNMGSSRCIERYDGVYYLGCW